MSSLRLGKALICLSQTIVVASAESLRIKVQELSWRGGLKCLGDKVCLSKSLDKQKRLSITLKSFLCASVTFKRVIIG